MKAFVLFLCFFLVSKSLPIPPGEWLTATHWIMYRINSQKGSKFDRSAVNEYQSKALNLDTMRQHLEGLALIPKEKSDYAAWMGEYYVSCALNDKIRFIKVSQYGGFFVDLETDQYYEIPIEKRTSWHLFLVKQFGALKQFEIR